MHAILAGIAEKRGTPCYVYLADEVRARAEALRAGLGGRFRTAFAVRANPHPAILKRLAGPTDFAVAASAAEMRAARTAGFAGDRLLLAGPAKRTLDLAAAVEARGATVVLESIEEAQLLEKVVAGSLGGAPVPALLLLTPRAAGPTPRGFPEEDLAAAVAAVRALPRLALRGFAATGESIPALAETLRAAAASAGLPAARLLFQPESPGLDGFDAAALAGCELILDAGGAAVAEAGIYLTRVVSVKDGRGRAFAVLDGGTHHRPAAAPGACRAYRVRPEAPGEPRRVYDLAGALGTADDFLGRAVDLPYLRAGDVLAFPGSGAFGLTACPFRFGAHPPPKEVLLETRSGRLAEDDVSADSPLRAP